MASDTDWVEDVRRWYFNGGQPPTVRSLPDRQPEAAKPDDMGYEAAHPALQSTLWAGHTSSGFGSLS